MGQGDQLGKGIEGAAVDVARLEHHDRGPPGLARQGVAAASSGASCPGESLGSTTMFAVPMPRQLGRARRGAVHFTRGEDAETRRAGQPVAIDVPARAREHGVPRRGQAGDVGHLAAGDEREGRWRRQAEHVLEPGAADLLDHGGRRATGIQPRVLVPCRREPVGGERRGKAGTDHPAVEAAPRAAQEAAGRIARQLVDDGDRVDALVRQRAREAPSQLGEWRGGTHGCGIERPEIRERQFGGSLEGGLLSGVEGHRIQRRFGGGSTTPAGAQSYVRPAFCATGCRRLSAHSRSGFAGPVSRGHRHQRPPPVLLLVQLDPGKYRVHRPSYSRAVQRIQPNALLDYDIRHLSIGRDADDRWGQVRPFQEGRPIRN